MSAPPFDHKHKNEIVYHAHNFIAELKEIYEKDGLDSLIDTVYRLADVCTKNQDWINSVSCSRGCSFCCYQRISITKWEADYIVAHVKEYNPNMKLLEKQNLVENFDSLPWADQKCSLLNDDGTCSIYDKRPLICRTHNSTDDPKICHRGNHPNTPHGQVFSVPTQALQYAMALVTGTQKLYALHEVLFQAKQQDEETVT